MTTPQSPGKRLCDHPGCRKAAISTDDGIQERFCRKHRWTTLRAMKRSKYLTRPIPRPYFTPDMNDPWPGKANVCGPVGEGVSFDDHSLSYLGNVAG